MTINGNYIKELLYDAMNKLRNVSKTVQTN